MKIRTLALALLVGLFCGSVQAGTIFSDDFEGGDWSKWIGYSNPTVIDDQNRAIFNTGDDIGGTPFTAFDGTKSGKKWGLYWYEGTSEAPLTGYTYAEWTGAAMEAMYDEVVTFNLQSFLSSNDSMIYGGNNTASMFIKFFDADYNEYIGDSQYLLLSEGSEDVWVARQLTATVPNYAVAMQVGIEVSQINWGGGAVWIDAVTVTVPDNDMTPPSPDPMSFAAAPVALNDQEISMTATTATDNFTAVEYNFICTTDNAFTSGWQSDTNYVAMGLSAGTAYTFTVSARDFSDAQNETASSPAASATTLGTDTDAPSPDPMTVDSADASPYTARVVATPASDPSGVEYYFTWVSGEGGHDSEWQDSNVYIDYDLSPATTYTYTVTARDKSAAQNATAPSAPEEVTTMDAPESGPLFDDLKGYTGDSSQIATRHEMLKNALEFTAISSERAVVLDSTGAGFGVITPGDAGRNVIRTVAGDYADESFEYYVTASGFAENEQIFVGIGPGDIGAYGVPDWSPNGETTNASIIVQVKGDALEVWSQESNTTGNWDPVVTPITLSSGTVQRVKVEYDATAGEATVRIDTDYDGATFSEDASVGPFTAPVYPVSGSRVYIAGDDGIILSDLVIAGGVIPPAIPVDDLTIQSVSGGMGLTWTSIVGQSYDVEYKTSLVGGTWTTDPTPGLSGISGTGGSITVTSTVDDDAVFYQVVTDNE